MKTILIFVSTLDGKITKWGDGMIRTWSSKADQEYFDNTWNDTHVIVMGSHTYRADPVKPVPKHLFIVLTRKPSTYKKLEVPGQLEFTDMLPLQLITRLMDTGEEKILIVGGAKVATSFLKARLIDEVWLTVEPKIFGRGGNFATGENLDITLELISCTRANDQGTLLTKYRVKRY